MPCHCTVADLPKTLFGFDGMQLVGQPLSSVIDVFADWKDGHGEEFSLLEMLVAQMTASTDLDAASSSGRACASWRVGVHKPHSRSHDELKVQLLL